LSKDEKKNKTKPGNLCYEWILTITSHRGKECKEFYIYGLYILSWHDTHVMYCSLFRHYASSRNVGGLILDEVTGFFNFPNPSSRTVTLGSTQLLTEIGTGNLGSK
jgi:hypothetical protein